MRQTCDVREVNTGAVIVTNCSLYIAELLKVAEFRDHSRDIIMED
jgi:hypothetical protein